jgi:hypothetical protein
LHKKPRARKTNVPFDFEPPPDIEDELDWIGVVLFTIVLLICGAVWALS